MTYDRASIDRPRRSHFEYDLAAHLHFLGTTFLRLGWLDQARTYAQQAIALYDREYHSLSNGNAARLDLALVYCRNGDVDHAITLGADVIDARGSVIDLRLKELDNALRAHRSLPAAREFHERVLLRGEKASWR